MTPVDRFVFDRTWLGDVPPPRRPLLLFDGGCPFCRAAARLVSKLDRTERLALLSRDDEAAALYAERIPERMSRPRGSSSSQLACG